MKAMLLSAGYGNRFKPHTNKVAKPAIPFLNIPMLGYPIYYLEQIGIEKLAINTHYLPANY